MTEYRQSKKKTNRTKAELQREVLALVKTSLAFERGRMEGAEAKIAQMETELCDLRAKIEKNACPNCGQCPVWESLWNITSGVVMEYYFSFDESTYQISPPEEGEGDHS